MNRENEQDISEIKNVFEEACQIYVNNNKELFEQRVSERTLCGALMIALHDTLKKTRYSDYSVDVEYNRYKADLKRLPKDIVENKTGCISCDLIVHKRACQDNLIALEMKKHACGTKYKDLDKERLKYLTSQEAYRDCNGYPFKYRLGVYAEVDFIRKRMDIIYYVDGKNPWRNVFVDLNDGTIVEQ